jgi:hypothetical protein
MRNESKSGGRDLRAGMLSKCVESKPDPSSVRIF